MDGIWQGGQFVLQSTIEDRMAAKDGRIALLEAQLADKQIAYDCLNRKIGGIIRDLEDQLSRAREGIRLAKMVAKNKQDQRDHERRKCEVLKQNDNPWNTENVLQSLIHATEYLLNDRSCDVHGYELWQICVERGKEILKQWAHEQSKETER